MAGESARESARRMRERSERIARAADKWERGAAGEESTAAALGALPSDSWTVLHDMRWPGRPRANIDHVVIGPPGVFVIDSKNWSGRIEIKDGVLRQNGHRREATVTGAADAAAAVGRLLATIRPGTVRGVLCFVRDEPVAGWAGDVMLCSTSNVVGMLTTRSAVLDEPDRTLVVHELEGAIRAAATAGQSVGSTRSRTAGVLTAPLRLALSSRPRTNRRSRGARKSFVSSFVGASVGLGAIGLALGHPEVFQKFGDAFVHVVVDSPSPSSPGERPPHGDVKRDVRRR